MPWLARYAVGYTTGTIVGKWDWWQRHAYHDEKMWNAWSLNVLAANREYQQAYPDAEPLDARDLDRCISHLANFASAEPVCQLS